MIPLTTEECTEMPTRSNTLDKSSPSGIRTTIKQDLKCTAAELVYGTALRLPGEFFTSTTNHLDPISYATQLKTFMQQLRPPSVHRQQRHFYMYLCFCKA